MDKPDIALVLEGASKKAPKRPPMDLGDEDLDELDEGAKSSPDIDADPSIVSAAGAVRTALKTGDDAEFAKTLKGFIELCGASKEGY